MINENIYVHMPKYPNINDNQSDYSPYNDEFNDVIFRKQEFYTAKQEQEEKTNDRIRKKLFQQTIISRFMSSQTLYDEMLVYHYPGTGKTCSAVRAIEQNFNYPYQILNFDSKLDKSFIIVNNDDLKKQFINQIIYTCTDGIYLPDSSLFPDYQGKELEEKMFKEAKKNIKKRYRIFTRDKFRKRIEIDLKFYDQNPQSFHDKYDNSIIVIDEVHHLVGFTDSETYNIYHEFLHKVKNRKILIMSGTPMTDRADQIVHVLNLILPMNQQLDVEMFNNNINENGTLTNLLQNEIENKIEGRVSYLKAKVGIPYRYMGYIISPLTDFKIYYDTMSQYQYDAYKKIKRGVDIDESDDIKESKGQGWNQGLVQASLFVYPDNLSGVDGFNKYVKFVENGKRSSAQFLNAYKDLSVDDKLKAIRKHSAKYASVIKQIIEHPKQNTFVYLELIKGSGAIIFGLCLELFGYSRAITKKDIERTVQKQNNDGNMELVDKPVPGLRYCIMSKTASKDSNFEQMRNYFNRRMNSDGKFIQVMIGGRATREGISFYSIQQIHIVQPHWNMAAIDQAIARGIRQNSHRYLHNKPPVHIYLHAACRHYDKDIGFTNEEMNEFIDLRQYQISQRKDRAIKQIEYIIKTNAFDCPLTYTQNQESSEFNFKRECEYNDCLYKCKGVNMNPDYTLNFDQYDTNSYYYDYNELYMVRLIQLLRDVFKMQDSITLRELIEHFNDSFTYFQIFQALHIIIEHNYVFKNKYGIDCYVQENNNIFYLVTSVLQNNLLSGFYAENPIVKENLSFVQMLEKVTSDINILQDQINLINEENYTRIIPRLSLSGKQIFIENSITQIMRGNKTKQIQFVLDEFRKHILKVNDVIYMTLFIDEGMIRKFVDGEWYDVTDSKEKEDIIKIAKRREDVQAQAQAQENQNVREINEHGETQPVNEGETPVGTPIGTPVGTPVGTPEKTQVKSKYEGCMAGQKFKLKDTSNPRSRGKECTTFKVDELKEILTGFGITPSGNKQKMCGEIKSYMERNRLMGGPC